MAQLRDAKGRFTSNKTNNNTTSNKEKENGTMMNNKMNAREERTMKLQEAGINVDNFFNLNLQIPLGAEVKISVNGKEMIVGQHKGNESKLDPRFCVTNVYGLLDDSDTHEVKTSGIDLSNDPIAQEIMEQGYVKNSNLFRRWVLAKTISMLNYKAWRNPSRTGWEACMKDCYAYSYQFTMLLDEIKVLSKLQKEDPEYFKERTHFFNGEVVMATLNDYLYRLEKYIKKQRKEKPRYYRGDEYVKLARYGNVLVKDLDTKVYNVIKKYITEVEKAVNKNNYKEIYEKLGEFMNGAYNKLPSDTPKCSRWKDAYKAIGGWESLKNMIRFHGVLLKNCEDKYDSEQHLYDLLDVFKGEEWRFHKLLVSTIELNNFDLRKSIADGNKAPNTSIARRY